MGGALWNCQSSPACLSFITVVRTKEASEHTVEFPGGAFGCSLYTCLLGKYIQVGIHKDGSKYPIFSFLYHSTSVLHTWSLAVQRCRDRMNNSSYVGYGNWNDDRFCAAVKEDSSMYVKHHGRMWRNCEMINLYARSCSIFIQLCTCCHDSYHDSEVVLRRYYRLWAISYTHPFV